MKFLVDAHFRRRLFRLPVMQHTLQILDKYDGEFDATLLVNCLLGLLVVPKESCSLYPIFLEVVKVSEADDE